MSRWCLLLTSCKEVDQHSCRNIAVDCRRFYTKPTSTAVNRSAPYKPDVDCRRHIRPEVDCRRRQWRSCEVSLYATPLQPYNAVSGRLDNIRKFRPETVVAGEAGTVLGGWIARLGEQLKWTGLVRRSMNWVALLRHVVTVVIIAGNVAHFWFSQVPVNMKFHIHTHIRNP